MYRYNPFIMEAIQEADEGKFGEIFSVEAQMSRHDKPETREWLGSFPGGMMFYLGCHLVDLVIRLRGEPTAIIPYNRSVDPNGIGTEDYAMAVLEYPNGVSFVKACAKEIGGFGRRQLVINGTEGSVEIKPLEIAQKGPGFLLRTQRTRRLPDGSPVHEETPTFGRYDTMLQTFAAIVRGEKDNPYTYDYELSVFRAVLACCGVDVDKK
jgi:predicted dehydrogenase